MITYYVKLDCGCCTESMRFKDQASIENAFAVAGLRNGAIITDDENQVHEGIDTFYGYWTEENENRGLDYLADQVNKLL